MLGVGYFFLASAFAAEIPREQLAFFEGKVRPILAENCYKCHSIEQSKAKGDLTLDTREGWQKGGKNGAVIKPGDPDNSPLVVAIGYQDDDLQMPPKGEKLSAAQIATLTEWVKMGAPDPRDAPKDIVAKLTGLSDKARSHWAYQPVKKPAIPENKGQEWCKTPVDAFILHQLAANEMQPNKPATKEALIRRAFYDLIGLPPTPYEVADFLKDNAPDAFGKVVDKLLASPHYGERWGRHWLDTARYSDTTGGDKKAGEEYRYDSAWTYRDYVIKAFNEDKPYDQFIIEQLAVDKLPGVGANDPRLAALGFITVGERFKNPNDIINDRIDAVCKGFLGLTVTCARCHDHKFDPIPTADYYSLHGIFASTTEAKQKPLIGEPQDRTALDDFQKKEAALETENRTIYYRTVGEGNAEFRAKAAPYLLAARFGGKNRADAEDIKARNKIMADAKLDQDLLQGVLRAAKFQRSPVFAPFLEFARLSDSEFAAKAPALAAEIAANNNPKRPVNQLIASAFAGATPQSFAEVAAIYGKLFKDIDADAKKFITDSAKAANEMVPGYTPDFMQLAKFPFNVEPAPNLDSAMLHAELETWPQKQKNRTPFVFAKINELELTHAGAPARAMAVGDAAQPRNSPILIRGEAQSKGAVVPRRFLEILSPGTRQDFSQGSGRLELAQAIANKANPLTARVMVNRLWMHHFGDGLVTTPDDLGVQCGQPSHPELLDYLAAKFMEFNWSMKQMHRLIMLSSVYQQTCDTNPAYEQKDPMNHLLWRANIRRLDFEATRDSLLVFSNKLDRTIGGKPVNLTDEPYSYRRSVYGYIDRGNLPELMQQFDFSDPDMPNSKRASTVVPQQALFLMNNSMVVDVARKLIARPEIAKTPNDDEKTRWLYRIIFQRLPKPNELEFARQFVFNAGNQNGLNAAPPVTESAAGPNARKFAKQQPPPKVPVPGGKKNGDARSAIQNKGEYVERKPLTPWEAYAQALLFTNEVAYVN